MPRILRIINRLNLGGPTYNAAYLSRYLPGRYETLLAAGMKDDSEESSEYIVEQMGLKPVYIPDMRRELSPAADYHSYRYIRKLIDDFKPDIVHTHAAKAGTLGRLAAIHANVPVIVHTFHGHVFHSYFGRIKTQFFLTVERYLASKSSAIIAISKTQKIELVNHYKLCNEQKVKVIPLGFDLSRFSQKQDELRKSFRSHYQVPDNTLAVGIIGRLVPVKNHGLFIKAFQYALANTEIPLRAFIIGDGECRKKVEELCNESGLSFSDGNISSKVDVVFTSWIKNIEWALAGLDIVALTSFNEGTPVSLIEAQAAGKPIVSTLTGGIADVVLENETALLTKSDDLSSFAQKLTLLINDAPLRQKLSVKGSEFVNEHFHYMRLVNDMAALYDSLLG